MHDELIPVDKDGREIGPAIRLASAQVVIGRRGICGIVLSFPNVSAHHCCLKRLGGYWQVTDLQSRNGTWVNETRIETAQVLQQGDVLRVGSQRFAVRYSDGRLPPAQVVAQTQVIHLEPSFGIPPLPSWWYESLAKWPRTTL